MRARKIFYEHVPVPPWTVQAAIDYGPAQPPLPAYEGGGLGRVPNGGDCDGVPPGLRDGAGPAEHGVAAQRVLAGVLDAVGVVAGAVVGVAAAAAPDGVLAAAVALRARAKLLLEFLLEFR